MARDLNGNPIEDWQIEQALALLLREGKRQRSLAWSLAWPASGAVLERAAAQYGEWTDNDMGWRRAKDAVDLLRAAGCRDTAQARAAVAKIEAARRERARERERAAR